MPRFQKIYLEISNICNLRCSFCPGTQRKKHALTQDEFAFLAEQLRPWTDYLYFHLMGEPLCHPLIGDFLEIASGMGYKVILTTNGVLLPRMQEILLSSAAVHKVNVSVHAFEANAIPCTFGDYLHGCISYAKAVGGKKLTVLRLWNQGGADALNSRILEMLHEAFPGPWQESRKGICIAPKTYLEYGDKFDWPDLSAADGGRSVFCYGLRDQIGVLCDGTVVPCCLDHEGDLALGNLFTQTMEEILDAPRAKSIYTGFSNRTAAEELCRKCGYARRFQ